MTPTQKRQRIRELIGRPGCHVPGTTFDPLSAKMAERLGFEAGMFSGSIASLVILGAPDLALITLSELADQVRRICGASEIPLIVDADHGYGNALNVRRTIQELESAGAALVTIEDTVLPREFGEKSMKLVSADEGRGKIRAAVEARQDASLVIAARTSLTPTDLPDVVARGRLYMQAGADMLFVTGAKTRDEVSTLSRELGVPMILGNIPEDLNDRAFLGANNVRILLPGHKPFMDAAKATFAALAAIRGSGSDIGDLPASQLVKLICGESDYEDIIRAYLE